MAAKINSQSKNELDITEWQLNWFDVNWNYVAIVFHPIP